MLPFVSLLGKQCLETLDNLYFISTEYASHFFTFLSVFGGIYLLCTYVNQSKYLFKGHSVPKSLLDKKVFQDVQTSRSSFSPLVYIYTISEMNKDCFEMTANSVKSQMTDLFSIDYVTRDSTRANKFVVSFDGSVDLSCIDVTSLPYWNGGKDHVIMFTNHITSRDIKNILKHEHGEAVICQSVFELSNFASDRDIVLPAVITGSNRPMMLPVYRNHIITFSGAQQMNINREEHSLFFDLKKLNNVSIDLNCTAARTHSHFNEWGICQDNQRRQRNLVDGTFTLIPLMEKGMKSTFAFQLRLSEALYYGSIPVCISDTKPPFPYAEILDWKRAAVTVDSRVLAHELIDLLSSFKPSIVFEMRRQGRILWDSYFGSRRTLLETALLVLRVRSSVPGPPPPSFPVEGKNINIKKWHTRPRLGYHFEDFHRTGDHFHEFPFSPFEPVLPPNLGRKGL